MLIKNLLIPHTCLIQGDTENNSKIIRSIINGMITNFFAYY